MSDYSKGVLDRLNSCKFTYRGWQTDKKLVTKHADSDEEAALHQLDLMERRQQLHTGKCSHPLYVQIKGKEWTYPESEWDVEKAIKYFKYGRDIFVQKVLRQGDRKEANHLKGSSARQGNSFSYDGESGTRSYRPGRRQGHTGRKPARGELKVEVKIQPKDRKRIDEFNRQTRAMIRDAESQIAGGGNRSGDGVLKSRQNRTTNATRRQNQARDKNNKSVVIQTESLGGRSGDRSTNATPRQKQAHDRKSKPGVKQTESLGGRSGRSGRSGDRTTNSGLRQKQDRNRKSKPGVKQTESLGGRSGRSDDRTTNATPRQKQAHDRSRKPGAKQTENPDTKNQQQSKNLSNNSRKITAPPRRRRTEHDENRETRHQNRPREKSVSPTRRAKDTGRNEEGSIGNDSSTLEQRKHQMREGTCTHPLYVAIQQRDWAHPDRESDLRAVLRYFKYGQDNMTETALYLADKKDREWREGQGHEGERNTTALPQSPRTNEKDHPAEADQQSIMSENPTATRLKARLRKEKEIASRRGDEARRRRKERSRTLDHPTYREIQERAWLYPGNEEDKKAAKYYLEVGHNKMIENILRDGDIKEDSFQYLQSGKRSHKILVDMDSAGFSYPGCQDDKALIEQTFFGKERALRLLTVMKSKQKLFDRRETAPTKTRRPSPRGVDGIPEKRKKTTTRNKKSQVQNSQAVEKKVGNARLKPVAGRPEKYGKKKKDGRKTTWQISDLRRPWNRW